MIAATTEVSTATGVCESAHYDGFEPIMLSLLDNKQNYSDIILIADEPVMLRNASGWYVDEGVAPYSRDVIERLLHKIEPDWEELLLHGEFSRPLVLGSWRLRISACLANRGLSQMLSVRRTPVDPRPLAKTGLPESVKLMVENQNGLVLISGPTGAGKTSTMAALVDYINETRNSHIVTIEDPIEYVFKKKKSIFTQREVGSDTPSFYEGVKSAMRQRPDVIVIGEIRDKVTAENAILAGESGHLVIATMHANSAYGTLQKLVSYFPAEEDAKFKSLAGCLLGVINQQIIPQVDTKLEGVMAAELLFNHEHAFSKFLNDAVKVNQMLDSGEGDSQSMMTCITELVRTGRIEKVEAVRSFAGQGSMSKTLRNKLVYM